MNHFQPAPATRGPGPLEVRQGKLKPEMDSDNIDPVWTLLHWIAPGVVVAASLLDASPETRRDELFGVPRPVAVEPIAFTAVSKGCPCSVTDRGGLNAEQEFSGAASPRIKAAIAAAQCGETTPAGKA